MSINPEHVAPSYRHHQKQATPRALLEVKGARLKWYDLHRDDRPIPASIHDLARAHLGRADLGFDGELGFVVLHRCGEEFYFLMVNTWRGNNELWETVFYKENDATPGFSIFPRDEQHKPTFCVWELGPVIHEKKAWDRFLMSKRDDQDEQAYLADAFSGAV